MFNNCCLVTSAMNGMSKGIYFFEYDNVSYRQRGDIR